MKDEANCNILLNTIHHQQGGGERAPSSARGQHHQQQQQRLLRRRGLEPLEDVDLGDASSVMCEVLSHVRQLNEEIHNRHTASDSDHHYKSEWRMVALVLDRMLLILFFIITVFTCVVIFVNVPY